MTRTTPYSECTSNSVAALAARCLIGEECHWPAESISANRVLLRRYRTSDAALAWEAIEESRATLGRWVPQVAALCSQTQVSAGLAGLELAWEQGRKCVYAVFAGEDGWFVGEVGLYTFDREDGAATIGIWLRDGAQGRGYGRCAFGALAVHALATLGLRAVHARIQPRNFRSRRLAESVGFRLIGRVPAQPASEGQVAEVLLYRLSPADVGLGTDAQPSDLLR